MIDIFLREDVIKLFNNKNVVFMGDSNMRCLYKDALCLFHQNKITSDTTFRHKMEQSVFGDDLVFHGLKTNGRDFREERKAVINKTKLSFFFLTRIYDDYVESLLKELKSTSVPDVVIVNSCLWDITRWGAGSVLKYKQNLRKFMGRLRDLMPNSLVIWLTTPPIAADLRGGFLVKELQFLKYSLRFHVVEANHYARGVVVEHGFDVLDVHYHLKLQIHRRKIDGIHWNPSCYRYITNLILTHISLAWDKPLPHRYVPIATEENELTSEEKFPVKEMKKKAAVDTPKRTDKKQKVLLDPPISSQMSQHGYLKKVDFKNRQKKIRKWQGQENVQYKSPQPFLHQTSGMSHYKSTGLSYAQHANGSPYPPTRYHFPQSSPMNLHSTGYSDMYPDSGYASPNNQFQVTITADTYEPTVDFELPHTPSIPIPQYGPPNRRCQDRFGSRSTYVPQSHPARARFVHSPNLPEPYLFIPVTVRRSYSPWNTRYGSF